MTLELFWAILRVPLWKKRTSKYHKIATKKREGKNVKTFSDSFL